MFLREGTQARATLFAILSATMASGTFVVTSAAADNGSRAGITRHGAGIVRGVEVPREVLPWRRAIEQKADQMLVAARRSLRVGRTRDAERGLRELVREYPGTYAASQGKRELAKLANAGTEIGRRGLGISPGRDLNPNAQVTTLDPVAGWETTVQPDVENIREALIEAAGDRVFFKQGSTNLDARARTTLKKQARWLKSQPKVKVRIAGHADDVGSVATNMRLSHDRAVAVRRQLIRFGVPTQRLRVFGHGKSKPIAICTIGTCGAQNRRVVTEIHISRQFSALE